MRLPLVALLCLLSAFAFCGARGPQRSVGSTTAGCWLLVAGRPFALPRGRPGSSGSTTRAGNWELGTALENTTQPARARRGREGGAEWAGGPLWWVGPKATTQRALGKNALGVRNEARRRQATNKQTNNAATRNAKRETRKQWVPAQQNATLSHETRKTTRDCANANTRRASEREASERAFRAPRPDCLQRVPVLVERGIIALDLVPRLHEEPPLKSTANLVLHYRTHRRGRLARDH